jgi:Raf kinase inhibitor-like YbhB/YbcL family protein
MRDSCPRWAALRLVSLASLASILAFGAAAADGTFKLQSSVIAPNSTLANDQVYNGFGCSGKNISPPLKWSGAPSATKSFALTMYDPDAPTGSGWWHWVVYNIPASVTELPQGAGDARGKLPAGAAQGRTDFGTSGYGGPCPPAGDKPHRYVFTLYALKTDKLDVPADGTAALIGFAIGANKLASARITALYGR